MICNFCGVELGDGPGHETQDACIEALHHEIHNLRRVLSVMRTPDELDPAPSPAPRLEPS